MSTSGTGNLNPSVPVANLGNTYVNGMRLKWLSTTTFQVGTGQARDSTNTMDIIMGANQYANSSAESGSAAASVAVTVTITASGAGGLDTGTLTASKNYSVFAIGSSTGQVAGSAVISLASPTTGPSLPLNYDCWRYVGSVSVDSGSHVRPFMQTGAQALRTIWFDPGTGASTQGVTIPSSATTGSTTFKNLGVLTTLVPQTALEVLYNVALTPNTAGNAIFLSAPTIDNGTTATVGAMAVLSAEVVSHAQVATVRVPCSLPNATQQSGLTIGNVVTTLFATTEASDAVVFLLNGYVDQL